MSNSLIHLASFPRSGNKFAQQILHHVFGLKCRTVYPVPSYPDEIAPTWDGVERDVIVKTHELWSSGGGIYVVRDPRDVYCSYARYQSHLQDRVITPLELIETTSWTEHVLSWRQAGVYVVRYEDLLREPVSTIKDILHRLSIAVDVIGMLPDWDRMHSNCPWYYQRGIAGRWREELSESEIDLCETRNRECMKWLGYAATSFPFPRNR